MFLDLILIPLLFMVKPAVNCSSNQHKLYAPNTDILTEEYATNTDILIKQFAAKYSPCHLTTCTCIVNNMQCLYN